MATLHLLRRPLVRFSLSSVVAVPFLLHRSRQNLISCEAASRPVSGSIPGSGGRDKKVPVIKDGGINPRAITQFSMGSVLGVLGGFAVSSFSKTLALLFGLTVFVVQTLESRGIHIVPTARIQHYFKNVDIRATLEDNVAFKLAFGATFALAAFGSF